jgi:putative thioredoxin
MKLAGHYRVRGFPTVIIFSKGEPLAHFSSNHPARWIEQWIEEHAGAALGE